MIRRASLVARLLAAGSLVAGGLLSRTRAPVAPPPMLAPPLVTWAMAALGAMAVLLAALPLILPRHRPWAAPLALAGFVGLAAVGLRLEMGAGWMLVTVVAALCSWDLERVEERLSHPNYAGSEAGRRVMEKQHLRRLLAVAAAGLILGSAALLAEASIAFLPAVLLSLLALLGLSWVVSFFRAWSE